MSAILKLETISVDDYLIAEQASDVRHELIDGYTFAMVGSTQRHNLIAGSLNALLRQHLRGTPCRVFTSDLKVRVNDNFYYPDLVVSCNPGSLSSNVATEPKIIVEVLSPSTESRDRTEKRLAYQRIASLEEYVLVSQNQSQVEVFRRSHNGWEVEIYGNKEKVKFTSLDFEVLIDLIYEDID